jgi:RNA polymerase-binding transcription factor
MKRNEFVKHTEKQLKARRDALRRTLAGDIGMLRAQHEGAVGDEIDAAIATEQAELRSQMASHESRELAQVENALDKIRHGHYGRCESCDKPISPVRLKALPYATECIICARREERRAAAPRGHSPVNRIASFAEEDSDANLDQAYEEIG